MKLFLLMAFLMSGVSAWACPDLSGSYNVDENDEGIFEVWAQKDCSFIELWYERDGRKISATIELHVDGVARQYNPVDEAHYYAINTWVEDKLRRHEVYMRPSKMTEIAEATYKLLPNGDLEKTLTRHFKGDKASETSVYILKRK